MTLDDLSAKPPYVSRVLKQENVEVASLLASLKPKWGVVYRDILIGYLGLFLGLAAPSALSDFSWGAALSALLGAVVVGFFFAYLQLFVHEAAHYNIGPTQRSNDIIANALLTIWLGQDIAAYRKVHFAHHRNLGRPTDPERSYFQRPGLRLFFETISLIHPLRTFVTYTSAAEPSAELRAGVLRRTVRLGLGIFLNGAVVLLSFWLFGWPPAVAWVLGVLCFFPVFATWRQLLEHRDIAADVDADYNLEPHGAYTRLFDDSLFARLFGGAGFNKHLLHHWFAKVSYTRFNELEAALSKSPSVQAIMNERRTTYGATLFALLRSQTQ